MGEDKPIRVHVIKRPDRRNWTMRYVDPTSEEIAEERSTHTPNKTLALLAAGQWQAELNAGTYSRSHLITWEEFRDRYEGEKLPSLAVRTQQAAGTALNHVERLLNPAKLKSLTAQALSHFQAELRRGGMKETSIAAYLAHLRAALSWAASVGLLPKVPRIHMPRRQKGARVMRGRPITAEEFERMLAAVPKVRPRDPGVWQRYLTGLWLSGLRLEESLALSWDGHEPFCIDLGGRHPRFRIYAEAEKGHRDRYLPMTPDFAEWLLQTPEDDREGPVFRVDGLDTGRPMTGKRVCRIISAIGREAGVVTDKQQDRCATAHDLRRSFATRWAPKVRPSTLQRVMRHASINTTMGYYVDQDADDLADELWAGHAAPPGCSGSPDSLPGDISGDSRHSNGGNGGAGADESGDGKPFGKPR